MTETFGSRLLRLRKDLDLTQEDLALKAYCTSTAIRNYEKGIREPTGRILLAMADALGVSPRYLLDGRSH